VHGKKQPFPPGLAGIREFDPAVKHACAPSD
jgi:hypothetical protein